MDGVTANISCQYYIIKANTIYYKINIIRWDAYNFEINFHRRDNNKKPQVKVPNDEIFIVYNLFTISLVTTVS